MSSILVIDDCSERQRVIKVALKEEGYQVIGTANPKIAWERIMNIHLRPDLIIINLENKQYAEILRIIHKAVLNMPVIILYRNKKQLSGLFIYMFWKTVKIPFNPVKLADEARNFFSA